ncbi:hypothetical protein F6X40_38825 [Paraburkholderia sp. UCT31]|uniref:hypothetical protein n=1 Tax=Paraburkholderia sp. UCT31 TaxID=2615209 RepID=UPI001655B6A6|nr:hypothetical protein [Paraburkholderia sp. UCT31]MBC8742462.1 hypothetical protein [Paraburkholderia sp. UCT31]
MQKERSGVRRQAPPIGTLLRYQARIVPVVAEARGQRAMIESRELGVVTPVLARTAPGTRQQLAFAMNASEVH